MGKLFTEQFAFGEGDSVVVIGLGRFGGAVAQSLISLGHDVMGIDRDADPVQAWADRLTHAVQADATVEITIDVGRRTVEAPAVGIEAPFELSDAVQDRFLNGLDDIGITLGHESHIDSYEATRPPWLPSTAAS